MNEKTVLGIDLGTAYSCVAYVNESGKPEVLTNAEGEWTTPSVVYFPPEENSVVVGKLAKEMTTTDPSEGASFVKRHMGKDDYRFTCKRGSFRPEEMSAWVLLKLVKDASDWLGREVKDVVITCPAHFFLREREATRKAGELAGLNVVGLLNEPTAAASFYFASSLAEGKGEEIVLVFDMGAGNTQATVVRGEKGKSVEIFCSDADGRLGGLDWDKRIAEHLAERFAAEHGGTAEKVVGDAETMAGLMQEAEWAKRRLIFETKTNCRVLHEGKTSLVELGRAEFEGMTRDLLEKAVGVAERTMQAAVARGVETPDRIVLVGGGTRMPQVRRLLEERFGCRVAGGVISSEPEFAVAKGAALSGRYLTTGGKDRGK